MDDIEDDVEYAPVGVRAPKANRTSVDFFLFLIVFVVVVVLLLLLLYYYYYFLQVTRTDRVDSWRTLEKGRKRSKLCWNLLN